MNFNGVQKIISLAINDASNIKVADVYAEWKQWVLQGTNSKYLPAFKVIGGEETSPGVYLSATYFLTNGWRIRPAEKNHQLNVSGNIFVEEGGSPFVQTLGNFNILVNLNTSNIVNTVNISGGSSNNSAITNQDKQDIADKVIPWVINTNADFKDWISPKIDNILGLLQNNFKLTEQVYNDNGNLISAKMKVFANSNDFDNDVNAINNYEILADYDDKNRLKNYKVKQR